MNLLFCQTCFAVYHPDARLCSSVRCKLTEFPLPLAELVQKDIAETLAKAMDSSIARAHQVIHELERKGIKLESL